MTSSPHEVTQLLVAWGNGDETARDQLMPLVYAELHRLAHHYMNLERPGHTLQTSALVNEAFVRLVDQRDVHWQNRAHFNPLTGRNRTPTIFNLDLGAAYPIMLGEGRQLRIQFDWFNVFNNQRAIRQNETLRANSGIPGAGFIQFPNPFFGQGTIFQYPSSIRLGIKFQF